MVPFELPSDRIAREGLQKRRTKEAERVQRVFNDKLRTIGVDQTALAIQIEEKKEKEQARKIEEREYDAEMLKNSKTACILHDKQAKERRGIEKAVATFRQQHQQPWQRREFDLNNPNSCKMTEPCDAQMILPGLVGEDLEAESRRQRQKEQLKEWLHQQQQEQMAERDQQKLEEQHYNHSRAEMDHRAEQLQSLELERRKAAAIATKKYNLSQIEEKQRWERDMNCKDKAYFNGETTGDKGTVGVSGATGFFISSERRIPLESALQMVRHQKQQMEETRRREAQWKMEEESLDKVRLVSARSALLMERQQARMNKQLRRHMDSTNAQLAEILKEQKPDIERGRVDDSFFSQFNTCSR